MTATAMEAVRSASVELGEKVKATPLGLTFKAKLEFEEWAWVGTRLGNLANASKWWLADWLLQGFGRYGALANEAAEKFGLSPDRLSDLRSLAERIEMPRRRGNLSIGHHEEVAYLEPVEQDAWLDRATAEDLSVMALRAAIRASRAAPSNGGSLVTLERITFTIPEDRAERWKRAADRAGVDFSEWAAGVLDEAAA